MPISLWSWTDHVVDFKARALGIDASIAVAVTACLALLAEWRRRRRNELWQLTLRDIVCAVTLVAAGCAYIASLYRSTAKQHRAVRDLVAIAETSPRDIPLNDGTSSTILIPWVAANEETRCAWFWECFPYHDLGPTNVSALHVFLHCAWPEQAADVFARLAHLRVLLIGPSGPLPDAVMQQVGKLTLLESLELNRVQVTDSQLAYLSRLNRLRRLNLIGNGITDEGLEHLHALKRLEVLDITNNHTTDAGIHALQQALPNLLILDD